jgi:hypothetical protein
MSYYLVVYDRSTGTVEVEEFADDERELALHRRFIREREQAKRPEVEIVVLGREPTRSGRGAGAGAPAGNPARLYFSFPAGGTSLSGRSRRRRGPGWCRS